MSIFSKEEHIEVVRKKGQRTRLIRSGDIMKPNKKGKLDKKIKEFEQKQRLSKQKEKALKKKLRAEKYKRIGKAIDKRASDISANINDYYGTGSSKKQVSHKKKQKRPSNKQYIIRNGVAYPIAGTGKKHKKHKTKKRSSGGSSYASQLRKNMDDII